ncbi:MAG: PD40 domain-containing protein [Chitinophagaceae bacterium]|nr:PD40 domain-containing protein [Chitinophagaceae bacterium]
MNIKLKDAAIIMAIIFASCTKENNTPDNNNDNNDGGQIGNGALYYSWAGEGVIKFDLTNRNRSIFLKDNYDRYGWDISADQSLKLEALDADNYRDIHFMLSRSTDGSIVKEFIYTPVDGGSYFNTGILSQDGTLIAIPASFDGGFVILTTDGKMVANIATINGENVAYGESIHWLPGNVVLVTHKNFIIKFPPPYTNGTLVKEMNYTEWGNINPSPDGTKIAVVINKHIYIMNADGSNVTQVTTSNFKEAQPIFSPDGKYIAAWTDYTITDQGGRFGYIKIFPADGNLYNVDPIEQNSKGVIPVIAKGETRPEPADGRLIWR